jgi:hypothetical protein
MDATLRWIFGLVALTAAVVAIAVAPRSGHADDKPVWTGVPPVITAPPNLPGPIGVYAPKGRPPVPTR